MIILNVFFFFVTGKIQKSDMINNDCFVSKNKGYQNVKNIFQFNLVFWIKTDRIPKKNRDFFPPVAEKMNGNHLSRLHLSPNFFFSGPLPPALFSSSLASDYLVIRDINQEIDLERVESTVINTSRTVSDGRVCAFVVLRRLYQIHL